MKHQKKTSTKKPKIENLFLQHNSIFRLFIFIKEIIFYFFVVVFFLLFFSLKNHFDSLLIEFVPI